MPEMQENLGDSVAHLWSKLCKLELKCGSLETGCDIDRKSKEGDDLDTDKQKMRRRKHRCSLSFYLIWLLIQMCNRAQCTAVIITVFWCKMSSTNSAKDIWQLLLTSTSVFSTHAPFINDLVHSLTNYWLSSTFFFAATNTFWVALTCSKVK